MVDAFYEPWTAEMFLEDLKAVPWFRNIGRSTAVDSRLRRIHRWEDWPGPEDPSVSELSTREQALHDEILGIAGEDRSELVRLWGRIHAVVFRSAASVVPYDPQQDAWHAPSTAVWQAAWTAGLVGLFQQSRHPIPMDLREQWNWFVRGHWPCGYACGRADDDRVLLIVY